VGALGGLGRARRARATPTTKQQNEAIIQTSVYHLNRGGKQKPANPRLKETKTNQWLKCYEEQLAISQFE